MSLFAVICAIYIGSYLAFRITHIEVRERDRQPYVIFPKDQMVLFRFYRPLTYADAVLTGMRFHLGPHQP